MSITLPLFVCTMLQVSIYITLLPFMCSMLSASMSLTLLPFVCTMPLLSMFLTLLPFVCPITQLPCPLPSALHLTNAPGFNVTNPTDIRSYNACTMLLVCTMSSLCTTLIITVWYFKLYSYLFLSYNFFLGSVALVVSFSVPLDNKNTIVS